MVYILILTISLGLAGSPLNEREISNNKFRKDFKEKYGYKWGAYGFNMDSNWEGIVDDNSPERIDDRDDDFDGDAEPSMSGGKE